MPATWSFCADLPPQTFDSLRALIPEIPASCQKIKLSGLLDPTNPKRLDRSIGGEREFERLIYHLKTKRTDIRLQLEAPYPNIQSGVPLKFSQAKGFHFNAKSQILPVSLQYYTDILTALKAHTAGLMPHEQKRFDNLIAAFNQGLIKTKTPNLELFTELGIWLSACPARKKLVQSYTDNPPEGHYAAFFPKTRLDIWHLKEPRIITLS